MAPKMKFRFRKQFTIIPKLLSWTASKKGASLNLKLGPMTKTWGTRGKNTTIDAPGRFGFFWRKQEPRRKGAGKLNAEEAAALSAAGAEKRWLFLSGLVVAGTAAAGAVRIFANPFSDCVASGHALMAFGLLVLAQVGAIALLRSIGIRRFGLFLLVAASVYVQWKLFGALAIDCPAPDAAPDPAPVAGPGKVDG